MFKLTYDNTPQNLTYYSLPTETANLIRAKPPNIASFISNTLQVTPLATDNFSADINPDTAQDDIIIAILSLLLLFAIESIVSAVLLRTRNGTLNNFSFSVRHISELARDFRVSSLWRRARSEDRARRLDPKLVAVAAVVVALSFGAQVAVLFLTNPALRDVTNHQATFRINEPFLPYWNDVWSQFSTAVTQPCASLALSGVEQNSTRISACLSSNVSLSASFVFQKATEPLNLTFVTDLHEFGSEHVLSIGPDAATYSSRAYFRLSDARYRIMPKAIVRFDRQKKIHEVHKQYVALLFSAYSRMMDDSDMSLSRLNMLNFTTSQREGPLIDIIIINQDKAVVRRTSRRYITSVVGVIPGGSAALSFAIPVLKSAIATVVSGADDRDLMMGSGNVNKFKATVWQEQYRSLNWLTLLVVLSSIIVVLLLLRYFLKPYVMAEIAGVFVSDAVGANDSAPFRMQNGVANSFCVELGEPELGFDRGFPEPGEENGYIAGKYGRR